MARRRRPDPPINAAGVPAELLDPASPAWASRTATLAWLAQHRLPAVNDAHLTHRRSRHRAAAGTWAIGAGVVLAKRPQFPDWAALRHLGITFASPDARQVLYEA